MQPQQPMQQPLPGSVMTPVGPSNQYDFIMNHGKGGKNWLTAASLKTRIIVVVGGLGVLLILALLFMSLLANSASNTNALLAIAQQQTELARVSRSAAKQAAEPTTQALAIAVRLSLLTDRQATITYMAGLGNQPATSDLARTQNSKTDQALDQARTQGTYDKTYISLIRSALATYQQTLKQEFAASSRPKERLLLSQEYAHAQLLVEQSNSAN